MTNRLTDKIDITTNGLYLADHLCTLDGHWWFERGLLVVRAYNLKGNYHDTYVLGCFSYPEAKDIVRCMNVGGKAEDAARVLKRAGFGGVL